MNVLDKAHPRVKAFVDACRAKVVSLNEFDAMVGGMTQRTRSQAMSNAGFYNVERDVIVINIDTPNAIAILDRTILHELGHWSGRSSRLQRKVIVSTERKIGYKSEDLEKEEITAELIALHLGMEFGIMTREWESKSENYVNSFRGASIYSCREEIRQGVWYLLQIATPNLQAG